MATAVAPLEVTSARQSEPGVEEGEPDRKLHGEVLNPQHRLYPPSNVAVQVLQPDKAPNPRPPRVSFAALRDPRLRMVRPSLSM